MKPPRKKNMTMSNTFDEKVAIISDCWALNADPKSPFQALFRYADIGFPLARLLDDGYVTIVDDRAKEFIEETYWLIAKTLELDPDIAYDSFRAMVDIWNANHSDEG